MFLVTGTQKKLEIVDVIVSLRSTLSPKVGLPRRIFFFSVVYPLKVYNTLLAIFNILRNKRVISLQTGVRVFYSKLASLVISRERRTISKIPNKVLERRSRLASVPNLTFIGLPTIELNSLKVCPDEPQ